MDDERKTRSLETIATQTYLKRDNVIRPLSLPLIQGTVFSAPSSMEHARLYQDGEDTFYQRFGHPTATALAEKISALENATDAVCFVSGMAAISTCLFAHVKTDGHIIAGDQLFDQTERLIKYVATLVGAQVDFIDTTDADNVALALRPNTCFVYVETPSNPTLAISDIRALSKLVRDNSALLIVDSTFATPMIQRPLDLGADVVLHSGTKFLNGHMDVMCGFVAGCEVGLAPIRELQRLFGGVIDPHAAWLTHRGLKTLGVRMERICRSALSIANFLQDHASVESVIYPLLPSHNNYKTSVAQMNGGGGVISFSLHKGVSCARRFLDSLSLIKIASSLGGVETVIELPYDLDWRKESGACTTSQRNVDLGLIRLSIGLEKPTELEDDLRQALDTIQ
jgi:methionine-gamma-lyase